MTGNKIYIYVIDTKDGRNEKIVQRVAAAIEAAPNKLHCIFQYIAFKTTKPFGAYTSSPCYYKLFSISMEKCSYVASIGDA